jgi:hypothetical protein
VLQDKLIDSIRKSMKLLVHQEDLDFEYYDFVVLLLRSDGIMVQFVIVLQEIHFDD